MVDYPIPTIDQIGGNTTMEKMRALAQQYIDFTTWIKTQVGEIQDGSIKSIETLPKSDSFDIIINFNSGTPAIVTIPETVVTTAGLMSPVKMAMLLDSFKGISYNSSATEFSITFTDNNNQTERVTIPTVGDVAGILTPTMYSSIISQLSGLIGNIATERARITQEITDRENADAELESEIMTKQPKLTAGTNITIDQTTNVISASGGGSTIELSDAIPKENGTPSAGTGIKASRDDHVHKQLVAGSGIDITDGVIKTTYPNTVAQTVPTLLCTGTIYPTNTTLNIGNLTIADYSYSGTLLLGGNGLTGGAVISGTKRVAINYSAVTGVKIPSGTNLNVFIGDYTGHVSGTFLLTSKGVNYYSGDTYVGVTNVYTNFSLNFDVVNGEITSDIPYTIPAKTFSFKSNGSLEYEISLLSISKGA